MLTEFREGLAEVRTRTWIWVLILYFGLFNIFVWPPFFVLGAAVANHSLGGAGAWAALLVAGSAGIAVGSLVAVRFGASRPLFWGELACGLSARRSSRCRSSAPSGSPGETRSGTRRCKSTCPSAPSPA